MLFRISLLFFMVLVCLVVSQAAAVTSNNSSTSSSKSGASKQVERGADDEDIISGSKNPKKKQEESKAAVVKTVEMEMPLNPAKKLLEKYFPSSPALRGGKKNKRKDSQQVSGPWGEELSGRGAMNISSSSSAAVRHFCGDLGELMRKWIFLKPKSKTRPVINSGGGAHAESIRARSSSGVPYLFAFSERILPEKNTEMEKKEEDGEKTQTKDDHNDNEDRFWAIFVLPGGAYRRVAVKREGLATVPLIQENLAANLRYKATVLVLKYTTAPEYPAQPLTELATAIRLVSLCPEKFEFLTEVNDDRVTRRNGVAEEEVRKKESPVKDQQLQSNGKDGKKFHQGSASTRKNNFTLMKIHYGLVGFSAGGHLAATFSAFHSRSLIRAPTTEKRGEEGKLLFYPYDKNQQNRDDKNNVVGESSVSPRQKIGLMKFEFVALCYPVISMSLALRHNASAFYLLSGGTRRTAAITSSEARPIGEEGGRRKNTSTTSNVSARSKRFLGDGDQNPAFIRHYSIEHHPRRFPKFVYLWHTKDDHSVSVLHSELMRDALLNSSTRVAARGDGSFSSSSSLSSSRRSDRKREIELKIYDRGGGHAGWTRPTAPKEVRKWASDMFQWLNPRLQKCI